MQPAQAPAPPKKIEVKKPESDPYKETLRTTSKKTCVLFVLNM